MNKIREFFERYNFIFLAALAVLFIHSRYKYLGEISYYLHIDELEAAYESICLAFFGTDSSNTGLHLVFTGLGKGHSAVPVYLGAILMRLKGGLFSIKLYRLISVAGGLFGLLFSYLVIEKLTGKKTYAFLEALLVTTLPVFFIANRACVEDYFYLYIVPAAVYFLLRGGAIGKLYPWLISGCLFALIVLSTKTAYITVPLFMIGSFLYLALYRRCTIREAVCFFTPAVLCIAALAVEGNWYLNMHFAAFRVNVMNIKALLWDDSHPFNISSTFGTMYVFSIPVIIVGVYVTLKKVYISIKNKVFEPMVLIWELLIVVLGCGLFTDKADIQAVNALYFSISVLLTEGLVYISENLRFSYIIAVAAYIITFGFFTHYYYENFNSEVNNSADHDTGVVIDKSVGEAYKATAKLFPDKQIGIITDDFAGRNLQIALYAGADPTDYAVFKDKNSYSFGNVSVNPEGDTDLSGNTVYIINEYEHRELIDDLTSRGWGNLFLKEYTVCFMHQ